MTTNKELAVDDGTPDDELSELVRKDPLGDDQQAKPPAAEETSLDQQILQELRDSETEHAAARRSLVPRGLDKTVFAVAGVLALGFVAWGFLGTDNLSATSQNALNWVMENTGWLFILLASLFVVYVLWLALGLFGNFPVG